MSQRAVVLLQCLSAKCWLGPPYCPLPNKPQQQQFQQRLTQEAVNTGLILLSSTGLWSLSARALLFRWIPGMRDEYNNKGTFNIFSEAPADLWSSAHKYTWLLAGRYP